MLPPFLHPPHPASFIHHHRNLAALRALAKNWMPVLLNTFLATPTVQRGHVEEAISAYACCCDAPTLAIFFRAAITKLIKVRLLHATCACCRGQQGGVGWQHVWRNLRLCLSDAVQHHA